MIKISLIPEIAEQLNNKQTRVRIASRIGKRGDKNAQYLYKQLKANRVNGELIKYGCLLAISEITGLEINQIIKIEK